MGVFHFEGVAASDIVPSGVLSSIIQWWACSDEVDCCLGAAVVISGG